MIKVLSAVLGLTGGLLLAGCTTDDPNQGGLLGGLIGLGGGAYQERIVDEKTALKGEQVRYRDKVGEGERLDQAFEGRRAHAEDLERELAALRQEMDDLDAEINALQSEESITQEDVRTAEADVALLLDDIDRIETEQGTKEQAKALGADADRETDPAEFGEPPREQVSELRAYIIKLQDAVDALKSARAKRTSEEQTGPNPAAD